MENFLRTRIRERLETLGMNPFEAARLSGAERTFVNDLLIGKKDTIRQKALPKLAQVLDCDPEYLTGVQHQVRRSGAEYVQTEAAKFLPLVGICEANAWRSSDAAGRRSTLPVPPDPRYSAADQVAFLMRGDSATQIGINDGDVLIVLKEASCRDGDIVVASRQRAGKEQEISARKIAGNLLVTGAISDKSAGIKLADAQILGRIVAAHRSF